MNHSLVDINQYQTKRLSNFCDEYNLSMSSLTIFPIYYDCFIQISPNNIYIAFVKNNNILEIYVKENKKSSFSILRTHYIKFKNCKSNKQTFSFVI